MNKLQKHKVVKESTIINQYYYDEKAFGNKNTIRQKWTPFGINGRGN